MTPLPTRAQTLKLETRELQDKNNALTSQNETLRMLTSEEAEQALGDFVKEKDKYKKQNEEMLQFLKDYGLKWVGGEGGQLEGAFDKQAIKEELNLSSSAAP